LSKVYVELDTADPETALESPGWFIAEDNHAKSSSSAEVEVKISSIFEKIPTGKEGLFFVVILQGYLMML